MILPAAAVENAPAVPAAIVAPAPSPAPAALPAPSAPVIAAVPPACIVSRAEARFDRALPRVARRVASGKPIKIVALGSSSTAGAGASTPGNSYPSQLAVELTKLLHGREVTVLNRGVNGEEAADMLARLDTDVIAENPDLVLWQVGTNSVLRDRPIDTRATVLHRGLARLKAIRADVILIDPQFAPKVNAKNGIDAMLAQIAWIAKEQNVDLFHRYSLMRRWHDGDHLGFDAFVSTDGLHMNDWSYSCLAKWIAAGIADAAERPTTIATGRRPAR